MYGYYYPHTKLAFDVGQFAKKYWLPLSAGGGALAGGIAGGLIDKEKPARGITIGALGGGLAGPAVTYGGMKLYKALSKATRSAPEHKYLQLEDGRIVLAYKSKNGWKFRDVDPRRASIKKIYRPAKGKGFKEINEKNIEKALSEAQIADYEPPLVFHKRQFRKKQSWFYPYEPSNLEKLAEVQDNVELFIKVAEEEGIDLSYMDPEELVYRAQIFADALEEDDYWDEDDDLEEKVSEAAYLGALEGELAAEEYIEKLAYGMYY